VGLGKACEIADKDLKRNMNHMKEMRDRLYTALKGKIKNIKINGHPDERLPNTLSLSFKDLDANTILSKIKEDVAVSAGAACHSDKIEVSHVLRAMNVPVEWARGTLRFSTGRMTSKKEIDQASELISSSVQQLLKTNSSHG